MQRNPHSYQIATGYRTFYSLSLIYQPITKKRLFLQQKISNIKKLLDNTEMSVQDIAMKLNFGSANYFSCFFKSKTGISPLSYRKKFEKLQEKAPKALY